MRTTFVISFALAAAFASSTAFAAGDTPAKPVQNFIRVLPPTAAVPATPIKLQLPATRQIVPEAATSQPSPQANFAPPPAPTPVPGPAPALPAPPQTASDTPDAGDDLQAEAPDTATPPSAKIEQPAPPASVEKPADAQALIQGDAAPAPQADDQAAPVEPAAPEAAPAPVKKKLVQGYVQEEPAYGGQGYGYADDCE